MRTPTRTPTPPEVLEVLWDHELRNGNLHRIQVVRFGRPPRAVVLLEVREIIRPELVRGSFPPPLDLIVGPDGEPGWGVGTAKGWRIDHAEWFARHADQALAALRKGKADTIMAAANAFAGRPSRGRDAT